MLSFHLDPNKLYLDALHQELLQEAQRKNMAQKSGQGEGRGMAKILAVTGKWLVNIGTVLETRYGAGYPNAAQMEQPGASGRG